MKVLVIHNKYKQQGGEDNSFLVEVEMLKGNGVSVDTMVFDNKDISSLGSMIRLSYESIYNFRSAKLIQEKIDEFQPNIIHVHNFFYLISPSIFWVAHKNKIPIAFTVRNYRLICVGSLLLRNGQLCELCIQKKFPIHGIVHKCHRNSAYQSAQLTMITGLHKLVGTWAKKVGRYVVLTEFAKRKLLSSGLKLNEHQIVVKPNFCDDRGFSLGDDRKDHYLFVGRLSHEKGIHLLLEALKLKKFRLKIIGTGPLKDDVESFVRKDSNLVYLGQKPNEEINEELRLSKALIFPSVWYEGMPRTILEAFSTGTPVISTDIDNINEIVTNGYNGLHFKNGDSNSLVETLNHFEQSNKASQLYINARKTFEEKYNARTNFKMLMAVYQEMLEC